MINLEQRSSLIDNLTEFARDSYSIDALFSVGDDNTECGDIRLLCVAKEGVEPVPAYKKLNFRIVNELKPLDGTVTSRDPARVVKEYALEDDVKLTVIVASEPAVDGWWRVIYDDSRCGRVLDRSARVQEDKIAQPAQEPETVVEPVAEPEPEIIPVIEPVVEPVIEPVAEPEPEIIPVVEPVAEPARETSGEENDYWSFVAQKIKVARHAIASESNICASETLNLLRHMLIELICVRAGVTENFDRAIDFINCAEKDRLVETYPKRMDQASLASALAAISELFDSLAD